MWGRPQTPASDRKRLASEAASRIDEERQKRFAEKMTPPAIFTVAIVETMSSAEIAKLLNDCWYDLVRTERRLMLDPRYDELRRQMRR